MLAIESALPEATVTEREDLGILGAPIDINGCCTGVVKAVERLSAMSSRLESINAYHAFFLLQNCFSMPRLLFKLRSSPCYRLHSELTQFDKTAVNTSRRQGGLIFSSAVNASLLAYASILSATRHLVGQIIQDVIYLISCQTSEVDSVAEHWTALGHEAITTDKKPFQRYWSSAVHEILFRSLLSDASPNRLNHIMTTTLSHSGDWIAA